MLCHRGTISDLADVAQLVEHFTRNEGVRGSSPRVGLGRRGKPVLSFARIGL
jgi:hypothetical protein